ncbi:MAG: Holliday junction branch migration DNA helicase RuvB [Planctomycetota bacterium]
MTDQPVFSARDLPEDRGLDLALRPRTFADFVGQRRLMENLKVYIRAAKERGESLDHLLFSGLPGLGKTTLSYLIAREMGTDIKPTAGPALARPKDLAGILTNLNAGDILFIDEIHRLPTIVEEYLYTAMEDFTIDIVLDQGPAARSIRLDLQRFTMIGATTREGQLSGPLRNRFGVNEKLEPYPPEDLFRILLQSATRLEVELDEDAADIVARHSRGTPRVANRFLKRLRDFAQVEADNRITTEVARSGLTRLGIDEYGLSSVDRKILRTLVRSGGTPVGLKTIAVSVGEEEQTIEDVYEPWLIRQSFLVKTPRGRQPTPRAYEVVPDAGEPPVEGGLFGPT